VAILLRIDVDDAYSRASFLGRRLNNLQLNYRLVPFTKAKYLKTLTLLLNYINNENISANIFFKVNTLPSKVLMRKLSNHEIYLHALALSSASSLKSELNLLERKTDRKVQGFSKHGHWDTWTGERGSISEYNPEKYIKFANKLRLKYFIGNSENPEKDYKKERTIIYFPGAFWLNELYRKEKYNIDWLIKVQRRRDIVVLLHPSEWLSNKQVTLDFKKLITCNFKLLSKIK